MSEIFFGSGRRGLSEAHLGEAEGQVPQPPKKYRKNGSRGEFLLNTFLCSSKEKFSGVLGRVSPAILMSIAAPVFLSKIYRKA